MVLPEYLKSGAAARLFPVLATTSKEGRTTSIVLACLTLIDELAAELLGSLGKSVGKRSEILAYTEVVLRESEKADRPDGLIVLKTGRKEWRALVETKVAKSTLEASQIERYRQLAKQNGIDCVITISNQFASSPMHHPLIGEFNKRLKVPVYHWSWMFILTVVDLLYSNSAVEDVDQKKLLNELRRFLSHESAGVDGFNRMPKEWGDLVRLASTAGRILKSSDEANTVAAAWHQETRDLSLIMTRKLDVMVRERISRKSAGDPLLRVKETIDGMCETNEVSSSFDIPNAASPMVIRANLAMRSIYVGMSVRAPEDKVSSRARLNWLLRQLKTELGENYFIKFHWPGRAEPTQCLLKEASEDSVWETDRGHLQVHTFEVFRLEKLGGRFGQQANFVQDLEAAVPKFYQDVGQHLSQWKKPAPRVRENPADVEEISDEAEATPLSNP